MVRPRAMDEIHVVTPDLFTRNGGIARITRATCAAIARHVGSTARVVVHALHDEPHAVDRRYLPAPHRFVGYRGVRESLALAVARATLRRDTRAVVFSHVNLATTALPVLRSGPPVAIVAHGIDVWDPLPIHRRLALQRAARVWAVSRFTGRVVRAMHGVAPSAIATLNNCLDPVWSQMPAPEATLPTGVRAPYFLLVSRLDVDVDDKGVLHTLAAFGRAQRAGQLSDWQLVIAGDGPRRAQVAAAAAGLDSVRVLGTVSDPTLRRLYAESAALVLPSAKEGFGLVFLEAMHFGRPVIAACASASPEVVADEQSGVLVPFGDVDALEFAMRRLARSATLREVLGQSGRELSRTRFSFEAYAQAVSTELAGLGVAPAPRL